VIPATGTLPSGACGPGGGYGIPQALASTKLQACFRLSGIKPVPGDDRPAMDGLNTRFPFLPHLPARSERSQRLCHSGQYQLVQRDTFSTELANV